jgi:P27 family predicted phage terminase small subunit
MKLEPPDYIDSRAAEEFNKVCELLGERVQPTDIYVIAEFAQAISDVKELMEIISIEGKTILNIESGATKMNPNVSLLMSRRQALSALTKELGLTPKSRKEKITPKKEKLKDLI